MYTSGVRDLPVPETSGSLSLPARIGMPQFFCRSCKGLPEEGFAANRSVCSRGSFRTVACGRPPDFMSVRDKNGKNPGRKDLSYLFRSRVISCLRGCPAVIFRRIYKASATT